MVLVSQAAQFTHNQALERTDVIGMLRRREPVVWINPDRRPAAEALPLLSVSVADLDEAIARWRRFAPVLELLFPELKKNSGVVESPLLPANNLARRVLPEAWGTLFIKADHALAVAGSIKARGGLYAVLCVVEQLALEHGLIAGFGSDYRKLIEPDAKALFSGYELSVGSTGNLGLSIGITGKAFGFDVAVHMSVEAKEWKKERLRDRGARVIEYQSDYTSACVAARSAAHGDPRKRFIDDENSRDLFLGYACAVPHFRDQLAQAGVYIASNRPLFLYLPCGVGGVPGGVTFAARLLFGDNAYVFFVEPVEAPAMIYGLCSGLHEAASIYDLNLTLRTEADGLATARPSKLVGPMMTHLLDGACTLEDAVMFQGLLDMYETEGIEVEPSAAAGAGVPKHLAASGEAMAYAAKRGLTALMKNAVHVLWTTGGSFVSNVQHAEFRTKAKAIVAKC